MDIYGAGTNIKKLLAYVEDLADSKPKMYAKSKDRLKEIATTCNKVVTVISEILEDEVLQDDSVEFGQGTDLDTVLNDMQYQIDRLRQFAQGSPPEVAKPAPKVTELPTISANVRKKAMKNYSTQLSKMANNETMYPFADRCSKLLWTWFDVRFLKTVYGTGFRYNMRRFPEWIQTIVILYGQAIHNNEVSLFENAFQDWLNTIISTDAKDKYAVPYEVYQFCKSSDKDVITLDAIILWDILLDNGLRELCTADKMDLYLNEYCVYDLCNELNPSVLDDYCNYETHPEIFIKLNWEVISNE